MDKRQLLKIIFGKEEVSDEELWDAGFALSFRNKIEVESKNISQYGKYKEEKLQEKFLKKMERVKTSWVELPNSTKDQIEVIMKMILYVAISLEDNAVTVQNVTEATLLFFQKLGYCAWGSRGSAWISWDEIKKVENETKYLTAKTVNALSNLINLYLLSSFLEAKKIAGKKYVIIPVTDILIASECNLNSIMENLSLDFDSETLVTAHDCKPLVFIDLRNYSVKKEMQMRRLEHLNRYLKAQN